MLNRLGVVDECDGPMDGRSWDGNGSVHLCALKPKIQLKTRAQNTHVTRTVIDTRLC